MSGQYCCRCCHAHSRDLPNAGSPAGATPGPQWSINQDGKPLVFGSASLSVPGVDPWAKGYARPVYTLVVDDKEFQFTEFAYTDDGLRLSGGATGETVEVRFG